MSRHSPILYTLPGATEQLKKYASDTTHFLFAIGEVRLLRMSAGGEKRGGGDAVAQRETFHRNLTETRALQSVQERIQRQEKRETMLAGMEPVFNALYEDNKARYAR